MTIRAFQDPKVIADIKAAYEYGTMSIEDIAVHYGVSYSSVRRLLTSLGLTKEVSTKPKETNKHGAELLSYLSALNIDTVDKLHNSIISHQAVKAYFNNLPIHERTRWLNDSVQPKEVSYAANPFALQHS